MPNSSKLKFNEIDQSFFVAGAVGGIAAISLTTKRGPYGHDGSVINSWPEFLRKYGGEDQAHPGVTLVKRAFSYGCSMRVNKVGNYTAIDDASTLTAVAATFPSTLGNGATDDLFEITLKHRGLDGNNVVVTIDPASNGDENAFNLDVLHLEESSLNESYTNLKIIGTPTIVESNYLDKLLSSKLVNFAYLNLSGLSGQQVPDQGTFSATGGINGATPTAADHAGSEVSSTGPYAFDQYTDFEVIAPFGNYALIVLQEYSNYANDRKDCVAFLHLPTSNSTVTSVVAFKDTLLIDSRFTAFFTGGLIINNPFSLVPTPYNIPEIGDIIGLAMLSSSKNGPWWSFAGTQRGLISGAFDVINNFTSGNHNKLDQLAQRQINTVVNEDGRIYIKGNFSAQLDTSRKSFLNVVRLVVYLKKSLRPTLAKYLEEPNDFALFRQIYNEVLPFLTSLTGIEKRALVEFDWKGDQYANTDAELDVNTREDLSQGKYRVQLFLKETVSLQEFTIDIISAPSGVSFDNN